MKNMNALKGCERGQVSVEYIIIVAAMVAVVLILAGWMQNTATRGASEMTNKTDDIFDIINSI
jgi:uncharacterized protein (UPF0333 family)